MILSGITHMVCCYCQHSRRDAGIPLRWPAPRMPSNFPRPRRRCCCWRRSNGGATPQRLQPCIPKPKLWPAQRLGCGPWLCWCAGAEGHRSLPSLLTKTGSCEVRGEGCAKGKSRQIPESPLVPARQSPGRPVPTQLPNDWSVGRQVKVQ